VTGGGSSIPEIQQLLRVLAAGRRCAEIGTAFGEGAAAIAESARELVTVELDEERAAVAQDRLAPFPHVELHVGDWHDVLPGRGPFELVFLDGGDAKDDPSVVDLVEPGGIFVLDDFTPNRPGPDSRRAFWLHDPRVSGVEFLTTPQTAAILATRR
jgi:predicted O-methyltransferase YrrM